MTAAKPTAKKTAGGKGVSKGGRPSKYKPEYCEAIVAHMAEGASATSFAASIGVSRSTITEWASEHPEFSAAVTRGKTMCAAWWEKLARTNAMTGDGNATLTVFGLKNMAPDDWREKQEVEHSGGVTVTKIVREIVRPQNPNA